MPSTLQPRVQWLAINDYCKLIKLSVNKHLNELSDVRHSKESFLYSRSTTKPNFAYHRKRSTAKVLHVTLEF